MTFDAAKLLDELFGAYKRPEQPVTNDHPDTDRIEGELKNRGLKDEPLGNNPDQSIRQMQELKPAPQIFPPIGAKVRMGDITQTLAEKLKGPMTLLDKLRGGIKRGWDMYSNAWQEVENKQVEARYQALKDGKEISGFTVDPAITAFRRANGDGPYTDEQIREIAASSIKMRNMMRGIAASVSLGGDLSRTGANRIGANFQDTMKPIMAPLRGDVSQPVFWHGTSLKDAESIVKNGFNPALSTSRAVHEAPDAMYMSQYLNEASMYGDVGVPFTLKKGAKVLDSGSELWAKIYGVSKNAAESYSARQKLLKLGYDAVDYGDELEVLNPKALVHLAEIGLKKLPKPFSK